jgi:hypothetical protein
MGENFLKISPFPSPSPETQFKKSDPLGYQKELLDFNSLRYFSLLLLLSFASLPSLIPFYELF